MAAIANAMANATGMRFADAADVAAQGAEGARRGPRQGNREDLAWITRSHSDRVVERLLPIAGRGRFTS